MSSREDGAPRPQYPDGTAVAGAAVALLAANLTHPRHEFWPESVQLPAALGETEDRLRGYRQLTDAYLLALAVRRKGVLATFGRGLRAFTGDLFGSALQIVPTR
jgi:hypothetical protein